MNKTCGILVLFLFLIHLSNHSPGQTYQQKLPSRTRILFLLDGSGSMLANWGPATRMEVAKKFLGDFVDSLKINPDLELALRVYGHQYDRRYQRCDDSRLEVPFGKENHEFIRQKLHQVQPKGTTPIAYSLQQAGTDFPKDQACRNIIIIITDGIESCDGDPCAVSLELQKKGIFLKPFIIGIGMDKDYTSQFGCMGSYFDAGNIPEFRNTLNRILLQSLDKTTASVELLDEKDQPVVTNLNITFINNFTGESVYDFVHFLDQNGKPDTVEMDAVLSYDVRVNSIPPVYSHNIKLQAGKHNVIRVKAPQGSLKVTQENSFEYQEGIKILVREAGRPEVLHVQDPGDEVRYLTGRYDLELLTLPRIRYTDVLILQDQATGIEVPPPGLANIQVNFPGFGSIYRLHPDNGTSWICNLDERITKTTLAIQPGKYELVFRAKNSLGSKYTQKKYFTIESGKTVNITF